MAFDAASRAGNQYLYTGRGPLDPKALVQTYAQLIDKATWTEGSSIVAYNGMVTAVWLDPDTSKNGIYFLHDSTVTNKFKAPDVTIETNWHKLGGLNDLPGLSEQIGNIQSELEQVKADVDELQDSATIVKDNFAAFPETGEPGRLYIAAQEAMTYVWYNGQYLPVGDGSGDDAPDIQIISGGGPSA